MGFEKSNPYDAYEKWNLIFLLEKQGLLCEVFSSRRGNEAIFINYQAGYK